MRKTDRAALVFKVRATTCGQIFLPCVEPVTVRELLECEARKPLRCGDAPPLNDGLFDVAGHQQISMF
jgi:hypothetical protein